MAQAEAVDLIEMIEELDLRDKIFYAMQENNEGRNFIPANAIASLASPDAVETELKTKFKGASLPKLVEYVLKKPAIKVVLILVLCKNIGAMANIYSIGFGDEHLPLDEQGTTNGGKQLQSLNQNASSFSALNPLLSWRLADREEFLERQWLFMAPVFTREQFAHKLHNRSPLPFLPFTETQNGTRGGMSGSIQEIKVHEAHQKVLPQGEKPIRVALKTILPQMSHYFQQEEETLSVIQNIDHQHLIKPIASYQYHNHEEGCFLFPWAERGNLKEFWKTGKISPLKDSDMMAWMLKQMCGLSEALGILHEKGRRHGDIKPENILLFEEGDYNGTLRIADVGLSKFHAEATERRILLQDRTKTMTGTTRYLSPEFVHENQIPRVFDVWSLGCVFIEFLIWTLHGYDRLFDFRKASCAHFWDEDHEVQGTFTIHAEVRTWIDNIEQILRGSETALESLFDLILSHMLVLKWTERSSSIDVHAMLAEICRDAQNDPRYLNDPEVERRARTNPPRPRESPQNPVLLDRPGMRLALAPQKDGSFDVHVEGLDITGSHDTSSISQIDPKPNHTQREQPASQADLNLDKDASGMRFSEVLKMKSVGPSDVGSSTNPGNTELWTDFGHASRGKLTTPTSAGDSAPKHHFTELDSDQIHIGNEDDAATVYSLAASVPEDDLETYKSELSEAILEAVLPHICDAEQLESLVSPLPALLQSFALRLGYPGSSKEEMEIMYFIHKHRNDIASRFEDELDSVAKKNEPQARWNVGQWLQGVPQGEAREPDLPYMHGDSYGSDMGGQKPQEEAEEQPSLPDNQRYRDVVFDSVAYSWLKATLVKTLTMAAVEEDMCANIREKIQASLGRTRAVSSRSPSKIHAMTFTLQWDPKVFLREQFPDESDTRRLFRQVLTLTGSATDAQILPCAEYLLQTWPTTGLSILEIMEDALVTGRQVSRELNDKSLVSCLFDHSELHINVEGTADSIATVAEQIIWLGASLRQSCSESGLATCRPQIRISGPTAAGAPPNCHVEFSVEEHNNSSQEPDDGQCWHEIFQNPVVVGGYPIPRRTQYGSGLEIPLNVMAGLTGCPRINQYMGHHFLKGFSTALVPTEKTNDAVLWHLYYSEDGSRLPYPNMEPMEKVNIGFGELARARHIVGWCSKAQFFAGAAGMNYAIRPSRLERPGREFALEKFSFSVGQIVTGGVQIAIGRKDTHLRITRDSYWRKLSWLDQKYVTLWDVDEERGWLVNGNSALLHLLRASLKYYKGNKFGSGCLFQEELFEESHRPCTIDSAGDVLSNSTNLKLNLYSREDSPYTETKDLPSGEPKTATAFTTVKDRIEELYEILEKLIDHNATSEDSYKGIDAKISRHDHLNGWDFTDIATDRDPFHLRRAKLPLDLMSWVELTRAIPAITLFGKGFGDMIRASPPAADCCQGWEAVPTNRHLLCVSVTDLRAIIDQIGDQGTNPITIAPGILWKNPFSDSPFHTACLCATRCEAMKEKTHHCIQELVSAKGHSLSTLTHSAFSKLGFPSPESVVDIHLTEHDNGAVIFGRRAEWKLSRGTSATTESPDPESSQVGVLGHSSTSGGSNVVDPLSPSPPATLRPSESEGRNSAVALSAVSTGSRDLGPTPTVGDAESGSQTPDSHQATGPELNDPPNQVVEDLSPKSSNPKGLSLRRKVTELLAKKWRERKSEDT